MNLGPEVQEITDVMHQHIFDPALTSTNVSGAFRGRFDNVALRH